jgi:hypothetical protein
MYKLEHTIKQKIFRKPLECILYLEEKQNLKQSNLNTFKTNNNHFVSRRKAKPEQLLRGELGNAKYYLSNQ